MRVLIACEHTGTVRRAFAAAGHDAWSCDVLPADDGSLQHLVGDVLFWLRAGWDLLIAHPPCTRLANSGVRWLHNPPRQLPASHYTLTERVEYQLLDRPGRIAFMWRSLERDAAFFAALWNAPVPHVCIENPIMSGHAKSRIAGYRPPAQSLQPWQFGHGECKRVCLWLRGLPPLVPTRLVTGRAQRVHRMSPGPNRWKERSRFFDGIAAAMAAQWSGAKESPA